MKLSLPALRRAAWLAAAVLLAGGLGWTALRLARSMRRGRGAVFSLSGPAASPSMKAADDLLARWAEARWEGPLSEDAWAALQRCPGLPPRRGAENDRRVVVVLPEHGSVAARRGLHVPAGGTVDFRLTVSSGAVLTFHTGALAESAGRMDLTTEILVPGRPPESVGVRRIAFAPKKTLPSIETTGLSVPWHSTEVDLSTWSGRSVTLRLRASFAPDASGSSATAHAVWASPVVWAPEQRPQAAAGARASAPRGRENVVWPVFETFPAPPSRVAAHNRFPGLDFLASEGVEFQRVYTNRTDAEGGLHRLLTGRLSDSPAGPREVSSREGRTLPLALKAAGYRTALWGAPGEDPGLWTELGFDEVHPAPPSGPGGEASLGGAAHWLAEQNGRGPYFLLAFVRAPMRGEDPSPRCWLRAARLSPLSLFRGRRWRSLAQAVQMDGALERLWSQVIRLGQDGRTLMAVASLRGTAFRPEPLRRASDGRLIRRVLTEPGWGLREEEVRVLWLMRHPRLGFGRSVTSPAQLLDAAPTVLGLLGLPSEKGMEGLSFAHKDAMATREDQGARFLIEGAGGDALVLDGHYKYIRRAPSRPIDADGEVARTDFDPEELYDLWTDPVERRNLARRRRDLLARARRAIGDHRPQRTEVRLVFQGYTDSPLQGTVFCPGGDLWNVSLSSGVLSRGGSNQASFTVSGPEALFSFETWPPRASFTLSVRAPRIVPAEAYLVSRLGLPLIESEKRTDWYDGNKFPWMDGFPAVGPAAGGPRVFMGRVPVREDAP